MRYSVFAGGKRLRPVLALAAAEAVAPPTPADAARALALPAACALEFIHTYSLVHDDLPAMDDDTLRRGRPTNHVVFGEGIAILAGDGLLTEAFALMAREPRAATIPRRSSRASCARSRIVAEAAGACGMVGGQAIDLAAAGAGRDAFDAEGLRAMHARKTGALIRAVGVGGAVMAGATSASWRRSSVSPRELASRFRSSTTSSTSKARRRCSARPPARMPPPASRLIRRCYGLEASRAMAAAVRRARARGARRAAGPRRPPAARSRAGSLQRTN